jgi:hypothetical protein
MEVKIGGRLWPDVQLVQFSGIGDAGTPFLPRWRMPPRLLQQQLLLPLLRQQQNDDCATMQGRHASECGCGCGCGVVGCGKSPCYVAFLPTSPVVDGVFKVLALGDLKTIVAAGNGNSSTASDVLAKMARII